ncbi:hypothetical protein CEXT_248531 [Caerostris extrusa]|uniref:Uncharacterized protein n=1 Tax=Caerostris extrusa TaxID=172846 RepID=A0AAV4SGZ6_CAEEX|nr:hypothetical protein CEXT_248531 [Caerostris extrusa]
MNNFPEWKISNFPLFYPEPTNPSLFRSVILHFSSIPPTTPILRPLCCLHCHPPPPCPSSDQTICVCVWGEGCWRWVDPTLACGGGWQTFNKWGWDWGVANRKKVTKAWRSFRKSSMRNAEFLLRNISQILKFNRKPDRLEQWIDITNQKGREIRSRISAY